MGAIVDKADELANRGEENAEKLGNHLVDGFQLFALFAIGATIVWSASVSYFGMMQKGVASVEDILLLFIFLELGAMVGIYFKTNRLPVQFLLYVAITVMTRSLASSLSIKDMTDQRLLVISGAILVLAIASFVLRYSTETEVPFITHTDNEGSEGRASKGRKN